MKYALIGCGRIAPNHLEAALNNKLEIVGICDIIPEKMNELLNKLELNDTSYNHYTDYHEMLEKEKPDLVAIATESGEHAKIALDCLDLGANVIIEKPIALSLEDADKIIVRHCLRGASKGVSGVQRCQSDHTDVHGVYEAGCLLSLFQKKQKHQNRQHSHHCHASCLQWAHGIVPLPCHVLEIQISDHSKLASCKIMYDIGAGKSCDFQNKRQNISDFFHDFLRAVFVQGCSAIHPML